MIMALIRRRTTAAISSLSSFYAHQNGKSCSFHCSIYFSTSSSSCSSHVSTDSRPQQEGFDNTNNTKPRSKIKGDRTQLEKFVSDGCKAGTITFEDALVLFDRLLQMRPLPSTVPFNQLLGALARMKHFSTVLTLYKRIVSSVEIQPDVYMLNILINCYRHLARVDLSFSILGTILKYSCQPNEVTFSTLIKGLCEEGKFENAMELFVKLGENGYHCNIVTYGTIIDGLCKAGKTQNAIQFLWEMEGEGKKPTTQTYNMIINGLCKEKLIDEGLKLFSKMIAKGISPNVVTYNCLIHGLSRFGRWKEATDYFDRMISDGLSPTVVTYSLLVDALCKEGRIMEAHEIVEVMVQRGIEPNAITYSTLINGFGLKGQMKDAIHAFHTMVSRGCEPDIITYNSLVVDGKIGKM